MKTAEFQYRQLLTHATALYNSERELSGIFGVLQANAENLTLQEELSREAEENKKHCTRLEGLLEVLNRNPHRTCHTEDAWNSFIKEFSITMRRIATKHVAFGYKAAIFAALALGQNEIAGLLKCCLANGNAIITIK
jgi:ferritin-like metal-binding protein YciE